MAEELRCAVWTRAQDVDPVGSATPFDALLLVEWPLPWPADVSAVEPLAAAAADRRATVMLVVPQEAPGDDGRARVVHHRRVGTHRFAGVDHLVPRDEVPALVAELLEDVTADHLDRPSAVGPAKRDVLVCGHGRRDPCCGRFGTLLHAEVAARRPDLRVWRCSHTGGHRYAPTGITVETGRAWAYLDADLLLGIVDRTVDVRSLRDHDRGTVALGSWAQAVEHQLLLEHGWGWLDVELTEARTDVAEDCRSAEVALRWRTPAGGEGGVQARVEVARTLPVLVCGEPPEHAKKTSDELVVRSLVSA
jgi:hypothetical protein